ncbi:MAG TPA: hypothetical protein VFZ68_06345 [Acidimicrobiales bacterium]
MTSRTPSKWKITTAGLVAAGLGATGMVAAGVASADGGEPEDVRTISLRDQASTTAPDAPVDVTPRAHDSVHSPASADSPDGADSPGSVDSP